MSIKKKIAEMIRVNHAGEFGAKVIYDGQIAALRLKKDEETAKLVEHMKEQEDTHFDYFNNQIICRDIRPTVMQPIWRIGGFALGFVTALIDKRAAMCCTTAVEEVIDQHYQEQINFIKNEEKFLDNHQKKELLILEEKIEKFRSEELEHRDIGYDNKAKELRYFNPLSMAIKFTTKTAITISKKI